MNCDVNKINDFFTTTEAELFLKDRKMSNISNTDSDMILSSEDHTINLEKLDVKKLQPEDGEKSTELQENIDKSSKDSTPSASDEPQAPLLDSNLNNKSISDLINVENFEDGTQGHIEPSRNKIDLLDHLFSFIETDGDLNYVLVGYFSKFLNLLLNKFPHKIIGYIYNERPDILEKILYHCDKKSLSEVAPKILLIESYLSGSEKDKATSLSIEKSNTSNAFAYLSSPLNLNLESILATRRTMLIKLFKKLIIKDDPEKISNLANICIEVTENRNILEIILNEKSILDHLTSTLAFNLNEQIDDSNFIFNYNYQEILNVFINIIRYTQVENLKTPTYKNESDDIVNSDNDKQHESLENTLLGECVLHNLEEILKNFSPSKGSGSESEINTETPKVISESTNKNNEPTEKSNISTTQLEGTFGNFYKPLGGKRVKLVEFVYYLLNYFKNVQSVLDKILIQSDYLKHMINYFFQHEWNNLYQLNFENFLKSYLNNINNHPEMTRYLFDELKFIEILITKGSVSTEDSEAGFSFNSGRKINNGYFAVLIELCHKISLIESNNSNFKNNYSTPKWENFLKEKVNYWRRLFDRRLCVPEAPQSTMAEEFSHTIHVNDDIKEEPKEETTEEHRESDNNPFQRDDYFFNMGNENDDWFNSKKAEDNFGTGEMLDDINSFEFVDEPRSYSKRKPSQEEILLKEKE